MQEPERTFQAGRRYVLGQGEDFYGIWDRDVPGRPVETFELSEAGLIAARKRIARLAGQEFWNRVGPRALRWALFGGLSVWIVAGTVLWIRYVIATPGPITPVLGSPGRIIYGDPGWVAAAQVAENLAFRLWIGAVAILVALRLFDRSRRPTEG